MYLWPVVLVRRRNPGKHSSIINSSGSSISSNSSSSISCCRQVVAARAVRRLSATEAYLLHGFLYYLYHTWATAAATAAAAAVTWTYVSHCHIVCITSSTYDFCSIPALHHHHHHSKQYVPSLKEGVLLHLSLRGTQRAADVPETVTLLLAVES